jgi:hypothetical protein
MRAAKLCSEPICALKSGMFTATLLQGSNLLTSKLNLDNTTLPNFQHSTISKTVNAQEAEV